MRRRTLLLDADIVAYKVSAVNEESYSFDPGDPAVFVDEAAARRHADDVVGEYCEALKTNSVQICLSDPAGNFRKELNPTYKANRKAAKKPQLLSLVKSYLASEYPSFIRPRLEADDVMGILATSRDRFIPGQKIMVSEDKDMRTIPGLVYNPNHPDLGIQRISELDANRFLMWQVITGDQTDGYPGCPGIGPASVYAEEIIGATRAELWDIVLWAYASKGFTEQDAIMQARMAFILRAYAYNFKEKMIRLWSPIWLR